MKDTAMDPIVPQLEAETRRRRRALMFRHRQIPVRMMVPNFVTLLGLCAGLTSIRMSIEGRWELALAAIVFAALLDGVDGRIARLLKASSRFGAELDSLADFVNFGVAPAILIFTWALGDLKSLGWICVLLFALASALRLARFNVANDDEKPKWQSNYFSGMPTPAAAIAVLLPTYLDNLGFSEIRTNHVFLHLVLGYTVFIAIMMVSSIPTYSGKLLHERISRELVLPIFVAAVALVALLVTYPYGTLTVISLAYLASIPVTYRAFARKEAEMAGKPTGEELAETTSHADMRSPDMPAAEAPAAAASMRVVDIRPVDPKR
ncbi:MAG: CDP-diacylglycerol--serine O-phosphatidyltransferase [Hyphomicrobiaceae bacterium]|nr:CDP-diacylglycerol--serine O-phosphatidyltransferase [Hyphomicrobiaceae bacterium]